MADTEGVLKNALDLMGFEEFEGKMLVVVPEQASIPQARQEFDDTGNLKDPKLEERVRNVGRQVARFAYLHGSCEANEFLQKWEKARENPGGEDR